MSMLALRERICIDGVFPERALARLQKAGISVYKVKKMQKNRLELQVKRKDVEKVFAIFSNVCYNRSANTTYSVQRCGAVGISKTLDFLVQRYAFVIGAVLFACVSVYADSLVLGVDFSASNVYAREARAVLAEYGIKPFCRYRIGNEDAICAKLLKLDGVEFCSVKRVGHRVVVEMRLHGKTAPLRVQGDMLAERSGTILSLTVLKGTPLKKVGDSVQTGDVLVGAHTQTEQGAFETVCVARVTLACTYDAVVVAEDSESAFAKGYLESAVDGELQSREVTPCVGGYRVTLSYRYTQAINF